MPPADDRPNTLYLSLGSNIAPETNLPAAVKLLDELTEMVAVSSVWESQPVGFTKQANFLNAAAIVISPLSAARFKREVIRSIERQLRRVRSRNKNGPRTIDLDIILFNDDILTLAGSRIPDPELLVRPFLALPLAEIAPNYRHPETRQTLAELASQFVIRPEEMRVRPDISQALKAVHPNRFLSTHH